MVPPIPYIVQISNNRLYIYICNHPQRRELYILTSRHQAKYSIWVLIYSLLSTLETLQIHCLMLLRKV